MNLTIILGNIFSFIAIIFCSISGTRKEKRQIVLYDIGAAINFALCDGVLKGYSGVVQNCVGILRNLVTLFLPKDKYIGWGLVVAAVVLGVYFNNRGLVGLIPVASSLFYSITMVSKKTNGRMLKLALIINNFSFAIYSFILFNYVGFLSDSFVGITALISFIKTRNDPIQE